MKTMTKLEKSIGFALRRNKDKDRIFQLEEEFVLSKNGCRLVRRLIGTPSTKGGDGCYFGSPLQSAILLLVAELDVIGGDWLWDAMAKCYGVSIDEICKRPAGSVPCRLPKYAR